MPKGAQRDTGKQLEGGRKGGGGGGEREVDWRVMKFPEWCYEKIYKEASLIFNIFKFYKASKSLNLGLSPMFCRQANITGS